ncbi:MAG: DNA-binding protein WhiA [Synergistaceae bacterium]|nr:DNA-binding protein WhiA [Synergistaceae bacterium]
MDRDLRLASLWDEWLASPIRSRTQADLEVSGLLLGMRNFTTTRLRAARRLTGPGKFPLWPLTSYARTHPLPISMITRPNHRPSVKFICTRKILKLPKTPRASWYWLKGLWGSTGGLYFPKSGYYLTLIVSDPETAAITRSALGLTGLSWSERRHEFTIRSHDDATTFLCNAGMPAGALDFDNMALMRSVRNRATRESNYDSANIARTLKAAGEQAELARKIIAEGMLDALPANLRELAELRLEYPEESLGGLGKKLTSPVTKATVRYMWRKIKEILDGSLNSKPCRANPQTLL